MADPKTLLLCDILASSEAFHFATVQPAWLPSELHCHDFIEVFWVTSGTGVEHFENSSRPLGPGDYAWVSAEEMHGISSSNDLCFINIAFASDTLNAVLSRYGAEICDPYDPSQYLMRGKINNSTRHMLERLIAPARSGHRSPAILDNILMTWCAVILPEIKEKQLSRLPHIPGWLRESLDKADLIHGGVKDLVSTCGYSREYVTRKCRECLGKSPGEVVLEKRMAVAALLLESSELSILDVAYQSGYPNVGHFHQTFRKTFECTPRQYRLNFRSIIPT